MNDDRDPDAALRQRLREIYEANHATLAAYALRRAASPEDAADAVAETFSVAWRRIRQVPAGHDATLWLFGTARRVLANQRRSERRRLRLSLRLKTELAGAQTATEERAGELDLARTALARLPEQQRDLLGLVAWEGLSNAELSVVLRCSENAAKIRLHRARRALQRELEQAGQWPTPTRVPLDGHEANAFSTPSPMPGETR